MKTRSMPIPWLLAHGVQLVWCWYVPSTVRYCSVGQGGPAVWKSPGFIYFASQMFLKYFVSKSRDDTGTIIGVIMYRIECRCVRWV